jgi:hypothetical protein
MLDPLAMLGLSRTTPAASAAGTARAPSDDADGSLASAAWPDAGGCTPAYGSAATADNFLLPDEPPCAHVDSQPPPAAPHAAPHGAGPRSPVLGSPPAWHGAALFAQPCGGGGDDASAAAAQQDARQRGQGEAGRDHERHAPWPQQGAAPGAQLLSPHDAAGERPLGHGPSAGAPQPGCCSDQAPGGGEPRAAPRRAYTLVLLDGATGEPLRPATEGDAERAARLLESDGSALSALSAAGPLPRAMSFREQSAAPSGASGGGGGGDEASGGVTGGAAAGGGGKRRASGEGGPRARARPRPRPPAAPSAAAGPAGERRNGPCMHCGADESPQWRKGPANKATLCNACGTRWRRTNALPPAHALAARRSASQKRSEESAS